MLRSKNSESYPRKLLKNEKKSTSSSPLVIAARRQSVKFLILFLSSRGTLLQVVLDFPGINEEIFATLSALPASGEGLVMRKEDASPPISPSPPRGG